MSMFGRDKGSAAQTPVVPPRPTKENPGMLKGVMQNVNPFMSTSQVSKALSSDSLKQERGPDSSQNPGIFKGVMQKVNPFKSSAQLPKNDAHGGRANAQEPDGDLQDKQNPGLMTSMIQKVNPFKSSQPKDTQSLHSDLSSSSGTLTDPNSVPDKRNPGTSKGITQKVNAFKSRTQVADDACETDSPVPSRMTEVERAICSDGSSSSESSDHSAMERHTIWYRDADTASEVVNQPTDVAREHTKTFIIKRILPKSFLGSGSKEAVEIQTLQLAEVPIPDEGTQLDPLNDEDGLLSWWKTVDGWDDWNEANQNDDDEEVVEQAADRVFMAACLFVHLFNQRGASLQQCILELLSLADSADNFHKKTVTASMGGGMASVAGSVTTITGLILAPFTAGTSLIVTAVGIGIATAGGVTSASANITDTMHSKTDRKKVEKMIHDYQDEIKDIKDCLEFLQEGMEKLEVWNFEKFTESISKKHLNQNVKHVMKEGGRAGKALVINTESLINTVQVLNVAGGAAKAAQVMSVTTGVVSGLFLALDVFFLAKDSMELKKGAKTEFAAKIREVCKELQDGLLELNRIKEVLQKTMDGIEVGVEEDYEEMLKSDLKKLIKLEE
ncbi:uncharacterized protein LOC124881379 isoform X1 [Girardinichthys multiradiatus]|uniref:uncharacterized protein LOC124881379 isoform X1 n=2 Tax=Girardinichthys multiradiatus TaxID=208333 RepID=UPI001FAB6CFA|nr:uncharacterized protein LOC124881379 isoform X1 [Girardinichthys multiradiatus]XP_047242918.1 uncharacterized protein LOC124881379 isoform X1 [Girardinichthys multiradiatus]